MLAEQSAEYLIAFLGVLRAGLVAVPLFEPSPLPGHLARLAVRDVVLIGPGELPRTSSGKVRRASCRTRYAEDAFGVRG
ncbi:hypothetical protein [Amycolatopsis anabasis]|uniref:hypothetical protein n=1 Tax=Amycolatopsis anabasis TaxID=1840409 RepID=UPI00131C0A78|nr:hypothetical protein [Amycolatopsis anabasis]